MNYSYTKTGGVESIAALIDGQLYQATDRHPNWERIEENCFDETLTAGDFDMGQKVADYLALSDDMEVKEGRLLFMGEQMHGVLADKILESVRNGDNAQPLVQFAEKLRSNPSRNSRDQLFNWLEKAGLELTPDGNVIGYKSVYSNPDNSDYSFRSVSSGKARVNGVAQVGQIFQSVGDTVSMDRSDVTDNPAVACSHGLHVGTLSYAKGFSGDTILIIHVDPADVVSVPQDSNFEKMRVCRYWVADVYKTEPKVLTHSFDSSLIKSASWQEIDETYGILTVELNNGVYNYEEVPLWNYETLVHSDSPGCWYITYIRYNYNLI